MNEALTLKTGDTYAVTNIELSAPRKESFEIMASGPLGGCYREILSICDISFRTPFSDLKTGICGAMTHGEEAWRVRIIEMSAGADSLVVRGLALVSATSEEVRPVPSPQPPATMPQVYMQFYDL